MKKRFKLSDKAIVAIVYAISIAAVVAILLSGCKAKNERAYATSEKDYACKHCPCMKYNKQIIKEQVDSILTQIFD